MAFFFFKQAEEEEGWARRVLKNVSLFIHSELPLPSAHPNLNVSFGFHRKRQTRLSLAPHEPRREEEERLHVCLFPGRSHTEEEEEEGGGRRRRTAPP